MKPSLALLALWSSLLLVACDAQRPADSAAPPPVADQPAADVPPANAPPPITPPPEPAPASGGPMPAAGAIGFAGFGPAAFGANEEAVRMAWGKELGGDRPAEAGGCYYLFPQPRPQAGYRLGFMIEGDKFARIDVDTADIVAPGGGKVGMGADEIRKLYAGRIEEQGHKYVEGGKYLRIKDSAGSKGMLVFAADAAGKVTEWHIGVPPQVDYVEGCS
ncbi:MAG TPA: hypothetical protein VGD21_08695 [Lysobacter sp.]